MPDGTKQLPEPMLTRDYWLPSRCIFIERMCKTCWQKLLYISVHLTEVNEFNGIVTGPNFHMEPEFTNRFVKLLDFLYKHGVNNLCMTSKIS